MKLSALGKSLTQLQALKVPFDLYLAEHNKSPLATLYNRAIEQASADQILVFVHDDVGLLDRHITQRLHEGLRQFDVLGVVGNRVMRPRQPAWSFPEKIGQWDMAHRLLGAVHHSLTDGQEILTRYGDTRCKAAVLDGLFIAAKAGVLQSKGVGFDPALAFHFYDLDFCLQLSKAGLHAGVWPIAISHASAGGYGHEAWRQSYQIFCKKHWGALPSAANTSTPPSSNSIKSGAPST
jgi:GT2 family glycosyltransferase